MRNLFFAVMGVSVLQRRARAQFASNLTIGSVSTVPENGNMPSETETQEVDITNAHISIEIDGGKESGSLQGAQPGVMVTVTMNVEGM